jgi:hypothetical protein
MDLTLTEILEHIPSCGEQELIELYELVEDVAAKIRQKQTSKIVANDANLTFKNGIYNLNVGNVQISGREVAYTDINTNKAKVCIWMEKCNKKNKCKFYHPEYDHRRIMHFGDTVNMKTLLSCPVEQLGTLLKFHPHMALEIVNLKNRVLDGLIRLLWISSDDIKV